MYTFVGSVLDFVYDLSNTTIIINIQVFWDMALCRLINSSCTFRRSSLSPSSGPKYCRTMKMDTASSSETSVSINRQFVTPQKVCIYIYIAESPKFLKVNVVLKYSVVLIYQRSKIQTLSRSCSNLDFITINRSKTQANYKSGFHFRPFSREESFPS